MSLTIFGQKWYRRLVKKEGKKTKALLEDYDRDSLKNKVVTCFVPDYQPLRRPDGTPSRIFTVFNDYIQLYSYLLKFNLEERSFFEIIFGNLAQKPHFDIDIAKEEVDKIYGETDFPQLLKLGEQLLEDLIESVEVIFEELGHHLSVSKDILIYSSHGKSKISFHLVINHYCHSNNEDAKAFYDRVIANMTNPHKNFIDPSPYSRIQQFRIIGCQKWHSNRPKFFMEKFKYKGVEYIHEYSEPFDNPSKKNLIIVYESLVSFTAGCIYLPIMTTEKSINLFENLEDLDLEQIKKALDLMYSTMKNCPFQYESVTGSLIVLKRLKPSYCQICERVHQNENPMLILAGNSVYWNCRRNKNKKLFLGKIDNGYVQEVVEDEIDEGPIFSFVTPKSSKKEEEVKTPETPKTPEIQTPKTPKISYNPILNIERMNKQINQGKSFKGKIASVYDQIQW